ncbi:MAG: tetratricopeptide repeat protein [bacterium]
MALVPPPSIIQEQKAPEEKEKEDLAKSEEEKKIKEKEPKAKPPAEIQLTKGQQHFVLKELWAGTILSQNGDEEGSRVHYQRILDILPDSPHVLTQMAKSYLETDDFDRALEFAERAIKADPSKPDAYEILGEAYAGKQQWTKAAEQYERLLEQNPYSISALNQMAEMQARGGQIDEAIETYRTLLRRDPGRSGLYYYYISSFLAGSQRYPEAIEAYLQFLDEYPDHFDTYFRVAGLYEDLGKYDEAISIYLRALKQSPKPETEILLRSQLAALYGARGSRAEAYAQYARIQQLSPDDTDAMSAMARLLSVDKEYDQALAMVDKVLSIQPDDLDTVLLKCEILSRKEDWKASADLYLGTLQGAIHADGLDQSKTRRADHVVKAILKGRARALFSRIERTNDLKSVLRQGIEKLPESPYFPLALLIVQVEAEEKDSDLPEDIERVLERWDAAITQNERETHALYLSALYENGTLGYLSESAASPIVTDLLIQASEKFKDDSASPLILSILQFGSGDWANAEKTLHLVTQRTDPADPSHHDALERLALAYEKMNRIDDAVGAIQKLIELIPDDARGYNMLGYLYADNNRNLSEAETLIKKAMELAPKNGNIVDSLGWLYYRQGRYEEALETLIQAKETSEEQHPVICDHLGDAYKATGKIPQAVEMWRKALEVGPQFPFDFTPEFKRTLEDKIRSAGQELTP